MFELLNIVNLFLIIVLIIVVVISVYFIKKQYDYYNNELDKLNNDLQTLISEHKQNVLIENKIQELKNQDIKNIEQDTEEEDKFNKDIIKTVSENNEIDFKKILSDNNNAIMSILNIITENQENITMDEEENEENTGNEIDNEQDLINKLHDKEDVKDIKYSVSTYITKTDTNEENNDSNNVYLKKYRVYDNIECIDTISELSDNINDSVKENTENNTESAEDLPIEDIEKSNVETEEKTSSENKINMCDVIIEEQNKKDEEFNKNDSFYREEIKKDIEDIKIQTLRKMYKFYNINGSKTLLKYNKQELYDLIKNYIDK